MSAEVHRSEKCRHLVLRLSGGELVPVALAEKLQEEGVSCGWLRASGVLRDIELRAYDARVGGLGAARLVAGPVQALFVEGAIGFVDGALSCSLRALLSREGDAGLEVIGGEIESARVITLEVVVTALDDLALPRSFGAGVPAPARAWSAALAASEDSQRELPRGAPAPATTSGAARMPQKPARQAIDLDAPVPETGDVVEHFAFGLCDVIKSDGDRLHLRVVKDGRIKEIALEMLRVTRLDTSEPPALREDGQPRRRFKLERRM